MDFSPVFGVRVKDGSGLALSSKSETWPQQKKSARRQLVELYSPKRGLDHQKTNQKGARGRVTETKAPRTLCTVIQKFNV